MGLYIPCGNTQTMWSCLCEMCHHLLDNFPQRQHQQRRITTLSAPTTTPDSQPPHHKRMQVKGPNDACRRLGPKCKFSTVIFYVTGLLLSTSPTPALFPRCPSSHRLSTRCLCPRRPHEPLLAVGQQVRLLRGNGHPQLPHHIAPPTHLRATAHRGDLEVLTRGKQGLSPGRKVIKSR